MKTTEILSVLVEIISKKQYPFELKFYNKSAEYRINMRHSAL